MEMSVEDCVSQSCRYSPSFLFYQEQNQVFLWRQTICAYGDRNAERLLLGAMIFRFQGLA